MDATPEANHVPPGTLSIQHRLATGPSASVASLAHALAKNGFDRSVETYAAYTKEHPGFHLDEDTFGAWFSSLSDLARSNDAIGLCRLWVHVYPKSIVAWMDLATAYEIANEQQGAMESYRQALKLDPHNTIIAREIQFLKSAKRQ